jgi:hypothetical protein
VQEKNSTFVTESGQQTFLSHMLNFFPIHQCHILFGTEFGKLRQIPNKIRSIPKLSELLTADVIG